MLFTVKVNLKYSMKQDLINVLKAIENVAKAQGYKITDWHIDDYVMKVVKIKTVKFTTHTRAGARRTEHQAVEKTGLNIYWSKRMFDRSNNFLFTVQTYLKHPKQGKTQLNRRGLTTKEVYQLIHNPREHTGKGYYTK